MNSQTPLGKVKNFGPVTTAEFKAMGFEFLEQLATYDYETLCRKWVERFPQRLNANAFLGIICTLEGVVWTKATARQRKLAHSLVKRLKAEYGIKR